MLTAFLLLLVFAALAVLVFRSGLSGFCSARTASRPHAGSSRCHSLSCLRTRCNIGRFGSPCRRGSRQNRFGSSIGEKRINPDGNRPGKPPAGLYVGSWSG